MSKKPTGIDRQTISDFWQSLMNEKGLLGLSSLRLVSATIVSIVIPFYIGKILATLGHQSAVTHEYVVILAISALGGFFSNLIGFQYFLKLQAKTMHRLQARAFDNLLKRSVGFYNNNVSGKLVSDAIDYSAAFNQLANTLYINGLGFAVVIIIGLIVIWLNSIVLGIVMTAMSAFVVIGAIYGSRKRSGNRHRRHAAGKAVTAHLADSIVNAPTIKTFAREKVELTKHGQLADHLLKLRTRDWMQAGREGSFRVGILLGIQVIFVATLIGLVNRQPNLLAIGIFAFSYSITLTNRLFEVSDMIRSIEEALLLAQPMTQILHQDIEIIDQPEATPLKVKKGEVVFDNVTFRYLDTTDQSHIFDKLSFRIKPGEKVGLVGPSGGGKSTLTRLMLRFEEIQTGSIRIDGQDISKVTQSSLRSSIAYVPQEPLLFHRSIKDNIAYGNLSADDSKITAAAKRASAHDFVNYLPDGYDTIVGERGVKLSGGQRQRIAIARAMIKDAPILILDEATSALDSESEALIQEALWKLMEGRTAIVIAHRLSTIQKMDRIIVLDQGQIVEEGSHKNLISANGLYAKLWQHQSGGFLEE